MLANYYCRGSGRTVVFYGASVLQVRALPEMSLEKNEKTGVFRYVSRIYRHSRRVFSLPLLHDVEPSEFAFLVFNVRAWVIANSLIIILVWEICVVEFECILRDIRKWSDVHARTML